MAGGDPGQTLPRVEAEEQIGAAMSWLSKSILTVAHSGVELEDRAHVQYVIADEHEALKCAVIFTCLHLAASVVAARVCRGPLPAFRQRKSVLNVTPVCCVLWLFRTSRTGGMFELKSCNVLRPPVRAVRSLRVTVIQRALARI
jgi:hypothetical protein